MQWPVPKPFESDPGVELQGVLAGPGPGPAAMSGHPASADAPPRPSDHPGELLETGPSPNSGHKLAAFGRCPQFWAFKYGGLDLIRTTDDVGADGLLGARGRGSSGHVGLAHFFRRAQAEQTGQDPEAFLPWPDAVMVHAWKRDRAAERDQKIARSTVWTDFAPTARDTVNAWIQHRFVVQQMRMRVLGVEMVIDLEPLFGFPHTRSVDLVVQHEDGRVYFWDHKFTARAITPQVKARYAIDDQFLDYQVFGPAAYGKAWGGVWANLIRWPGRGKVEMDLGRVPPAPAAVAARREQAQRVWQELAWQRLVQPDLTRWPKRLSELVCVTPYGLCAAYDLCAHGVPSIQVRVD